jgi:hypothetical protein
MTAYSSDIYTTRTATMSSIISNAIVQKVEMDIAGGVERIQTNKMSNAMYFPDDIFKVIMSYTASLPTCDVKKCKFVATEVCELCKDEFCKNCMEKDNEDGLCKKCVNRGFAKCQICYSELTNMECDECGQLFCMGCVKRDEDGLIYPERCVLESELDDEEE